MNYRTTVILAVMAIVVGIALFFVFQHERQTTIIVEGQNRLFASLTASDISEIVIERGQPDPQRVVLERFDSQWRLREPVAALAGADEAQHVATLLAGLQYDRSLELTSENAAQFGLAPPMATVSFRSTSGRHELLVGSAAGLAGDQFAYVTRPGDSVAYLVDRQINSVAAADAEDFRSRSLLEFDPQSINTIKLERDDQTIILHRTEGQWRLAEPVRALAGQQAVDTIIQNLAQLQAAQFVDDEPQSLDEFGLDNPQLSVELSPSDGFPSAEEPSESDLVRVNFGLHADLDRNLVYARVLPQANVYSVAGTAFRDINKGLDQLRSNRLVNLDPESLEFLSIEVDGTSVSLEREDNRWRMTAPEKANADSAEVNRLLRTLSELEVRAWSDKVSLADPSVGLDAPRGTIRWRHKGETQNNFVRIGRRTADDRQWAMEGRSNIAAAINPAAIDALNRSWMSLYDRTIWDVSPQQIRRVRWTLDGQTVTIERLDSTGGDSATAAADDAWRMTSPVEMAIDQQRAETLLQAAATVRAADFVAPVSAAMDYDLDEPNLQLTLWLQLPDGDGLKQMDLAGALKDGRWYGLAADVPLMALPESLIHALRRPLTGGGPVDFDASRVSQIEITSPDWQLILGRSGADWSVLGDAPFDVNPDRPAAYLEDLQEVEPFSVASYKADNLVDYGLEEPQWSILLRILGGDIELLVSGNGPEDGLKYATVKGTGIVYTLDATSLSRIQRQRLFFRQTN